MHAPPFYREDGSTGRLEIFHDVTERRRSEAALRSSEEELRHLSSQLLTVQEGERSRISRELHDELGQAMMVLKLRLGLMANRVPAADMELRTELEEMLSYVDEMIENVRRLSRDLSPSILEDLGLGTALSRLIRDFGGASGIKVTAELDSIDSMLQKDRHIILYRVFQEALTNVARHSRARKVDVKVQALPDSIECSVSDDGIGLGDEASAHGLGLRTMRERVRMLDATLTITSRPTQGTTIHFSLPRGRT